jgi:Ca2+-binding EF-hand superfamily protein
LINSSKAFINKITIIMAFNGLTQSQKDDLKLAFNCCDSKGTGAICVEELLDALHCLDYDNKTKVLYQAVKELNTEEVRANGLRFETLIEKIDSKLHSNDKKEQLQRLYDILTNENNNTKPLDFEHLKNIITHDLGSYMPDDDLYELIKRVGSNGEVTFEDFCKKF